MQQVLDEESLLTVFCEVESILNYRPVTSSSDDSNNLEALTPKHILQLRANPILPPGLFKRDDLYSRRRWKQVQYIVDRWIKEYLELMQEHQKWNEVH